MKYPIPPEEDFDDKFKFGDKINNFDLVEGFRKTPLIAYNYIDLGSTDYNFKQEVFDNYDICAYFETLKTFSNLSINELTEVKCNSDHFRIDNSIKSNLRNLLLQISGKSNFVPEQIPPIGHFALYTSREGASRRSKVKSPRIYFMIGPKGIFYILFYDPYHEINP